VSHGETTTSEKRTTLLPYILRGTFTTNTAVWFKLFGFFVRKLVPLGKRLALGFDLGQPLPAWRASAAACRAAVHNRASSRRETSGMISTRFQPSARIASASLSSRAAQSRSSKAGSVR
jgi:hypothetical protein